MHINVHQASSSRLLTKITNAYMVPKNQKISKAWMLGDFFFFSVPYGFWMSLRIGWCPSHLIPNLAGL